VKMSFSVDNVQYDDLSIESSDGRFEPLITIHCSERRSVLDLDILRTSEKCPPAQSGAIADGSVTAGVCVSVILHSDVIQVKTGVRIPPDCGSFFSAFGSSVRSGSLCGFFSSRRKAEQDTFQTSRVDSCCLVHLISV
jgi:hypothetical protein